MTTICKGDAAGIYLDGKLQAVGIAREPTATQVRFHAPGYGTDAYSLRTQICIGKRRLSFKCLPPAEAAAARQELEDRIKEKERQDVADRQAAYDALPESVKLARSLKWLCDCENEKVIAGAPIEAMRAIVAWAVENKLTTE